MYIIINESYDFYKKYIQPNVSYNNEFNLLNKLCSTNNFVVIKDKKWRDNNPNNLHILAICKKNIKSIRDLSSRDVNMLETIKKTVTNYIYNEYNISSDKLNTYLHYYPNIWRLHIHFSSINKSDIKKNELRAGVAHYIDDVINNLRIDSNYYKKSDIIIYAKEAKIKKIIYNNTI